MAKTQTTTTKSPFLFVPENGVYELDAQAVVEMQNHAFGHNPKVHFSMYTGDDPGSGVPTFDVAFPAGSGYTTYFQGRTWVDSDVETIDLDFSVNVSGAVTVHVRVTIGSDNTILAFTGPGSVRQTGTIDVATAVAGKRAFTIELNNTPASGTHILEDGRVEDQAWTSTLPDPPDE